MKEFEKGYWVNRDGSVWSDSNWRGYGRRRLSAVPDKDGYPRVRIKVSRKPKWVRVHCEARKEIRPYKENGSD